MTETIILGAVIIFEMAIIVWDRRESRKREQSLITALLSRSAPEYAASEAKMNTSAKDEIKKLKAENDLALEAQKLMKSNGVRVR